MRSPLAKNPNWTLLLWMLAGYFVYAMVTFWFVLLYTVGPLFWVLRPLLEAIGIPQGHHLAQLAAFGVLIGFSVGWLQRQVMRARLLWPAPRWVMVSALGGAVGTVLALETVPLIMQRQLYDTTELGRLLMFMLPIAVPMAVGQWWVLRRVVRDAWLWIAANVLGAVGWAMMGSAISVGTPGRDLLLALTMPLAQAAITGMAIIWLFERQLRSGKPH